LRFRGAFIRHPCPMTIPQALQIAAQHHQAGRLAEAETVYRQILAVQPRHADAIRLLGVIARQVGRHDLAVELIHQAIALDPNNPFAHHDLGEARWAMGRFDEATAAFRRALQLRPDFAQAWNNLGVALAEQRRSDEAIAAYRRALELQPDHVEAGNNLGAALKDQGNLDEAIAAFRRALQLQPEHAKVHSNLVYTLHFHPAFDPRSIASERERWNRRFCEPRKRFILPHTNDPSPSRRLRIGYVSPEFCDHVVGRNLLPLFEHHNREQFEIYCYSGVARPDRFTAEFRRHADQWRSIVGASDEALAGMIRQDAVDILVDPSQHMAGNRLPMFARKPAPVQVSFAGYPATAGLDTIEHRISDRYLEGASPSEETDRNEQVHVIDSFWCYDPRGLEIAVNALPAVESGSITFGCLNNFCKVTEPMLRVWGRVLCRAPGSRLVLMANAGSCRQRTLETLGSAGVGAHRVEFQEYRLRRKYLESYHRLDIVLDTFPYNGHTTSLDALWMGVPVVSLAGTSPLSRGGFSQLTNLGLPEFVAHSELEYVDVAEDLARDLPRLAELRATLRPRMQASPLMDAPRFARNVEAACRKMWERWCSGQLPPREA